MNEAFITVDVGNHSSKAMLWENGEISFRGSLSEVFEKRPKDYALALTCVGKLKEEEEKILDQLQKESITSLNVQNIYKNRAFLEMPVDYSETLGVDRLMGAYQIFREFHSAAHADSLSLVIDAGSFTTLDFVNKKGFLGGHIFPSHYQWKEAYKSGFQLKKHLDNMPENLLTSAKKGELPHDSASAIFQSYPMALVGLINQLLSFFRPQRVFLTGGEAPQLKELWENLGSKNVSPTIREELVHQGLFLALSDLLRRH